METCFRRYPDGTPNLKKCFVKTPGGFAAHLTTVRWALLSPRFIYICPFVATPCAPAGPGDSPAHALGMAWLQTAFLRVFAVSPFMAPMVPLM